jgi:hypothetical protein
MQRSFFERQLLPDGERQQGLRQQTLANALGTFIDVHACPNWPSFGRGHRRATPSGLLIAFLVFTSLLFDLDEFTLHMKVRQL